MEAVVNAACRMTAACSVHCELELASPGHEGLLRHHGTSASWDQRIMGSGTRGTEAQRIHKLFTFTF